MHTLKRQLAAFLPGLPGWVRRLRFPHDNHPIPFWFEPSHYQINIQRALRDLCRPGDVIFDVGANLGQLTVLMSRLVGPVGYVLAFEGSDRVLPYCQHNLTVNGCHNVQLYHRAVYSQSGEVVKLYYHKENFGGDTLREYYGSQHPHARVRTVALDDVMDASGLVPHLIKMDIEGGEYDALQGMTTLLNEVQPYIILEERTQEMRCHAFLSELGYVALDLATYRPVQTQSDLHPDLRLADLLFIHTSKLGQVPYSWPLALESCYTLGPHDVLAYPGGGFRFKDGLPLSAGRYVIGLSLTSQNQHDPFTLVFSDQTTRDVLFRVQSSNLQYFRTLEQSWVLHIESDTRLMVDLHLPAGGADASVTLQEVTIQQVPQLDDLPPPLLT